MARDAIAFIAALGLSQIDLLGFSMGSFVAQEVALTRARAWYAAALGYELQFAFQPPGGGPAAMLHDPAGALMELFEVPQASKGRATDAAMLPRVGHVALEVNDLDAVLAAVTAAGGTKLLGPLPAPTPGRRLAFVGDLDGNVLELIGPVEGPPHE